MGKPVAVPLLEYIEHDFQGKETIINRQHSYGKNDERIKHYQFLVNSIE